MLGKLNEWNERRRHNVNVDIFKETTKEEEMRECGMWNWNGMKKNEQSTKHPPTSQSVNVNTNAMDGIIGSSDCRLIGLLAGRKLGLLCLMRVMMGSSIAGYMGTKHTDDDVIFRIFSMTKFVVVEWIDSLDCEWQAGRPTNNNNKQTICGTTKRARDQWMIGI